MSLKIVVPVSGGKDSEACLKLAIEKYSPDEVRGMFCDTQWEHPTTYKHIENMRERYGIQIDVVSSSSVEQEVLKIGRFPNAFARFCTDRLKIIPSKKYYESLQKTLGHGFVVWMGMRKDESTKRKNRFAKTLSSEVYPPHIINSSFPKRMEKNGIYFMLPIVDWSTEEVFDYVGIENVSPLYKQGFDRVGCFPCLASTEQKHQNAFNYDAFGASQREKVINMERITGVKHEPANTDQMCMLCNI
ncbi:phosphoadenosine phosphosulfate reductase family protein [Methylophaga sp.]|uniref:phosphoadenosine phosphosulfate reductase family protein n=1 Tax=Methylophaga sp. TaxID=2024840 RepID=UPI003A953226